MADLTIKAANVKWVADRAPLVEKAGATITRGQVVYRDASTGTYKLAKADGTDTAVVAGIAISDGYDGSHFLLAAPGATIDWGATLTAGRVYVLSATTDGAIGGLARPISGNATVVLAVGGGNREAMILVTAPEII